MNYSNGENIEIGDNVLIEEGRTSGTVEFIIESSEEINYWNLDEPGVLLKSEPFGSVFWPMNNEHDPVVFVSRKNI